MKFGPPPPCHFITIPLAPHAATHTTRDYFIVSSKSIFLFPFAPKMVCKWMTTEHTTFGGCLRGSSESGSCPDNRKSIESCSWLWRWGALCIRFWKVCAGRICKATWDIRRPAIEKFLSLKSWENIQGNKLKTGDYADTRKWRQWGLSSCWISAHTER